LTGSMGCSIAYEGAERCRKGQTWFETTGENKQLKR
jgi:hypothetical protein